LDAVFLTVAAAVAAAAASVAELLCHLILQNDRKICRTSQPFFGDIVQHVVSPLALTTLVRMAPFNSLIYSCATQFDPVLS